MGGNKDESVDLACVHPGILRFAGGHKKPGYRTRRSSYRTPRSTAGIYSGSGVMQAMGKAIEATLLSMVREIVFGVGFALILPKFLALDGVLYSMPVSDALTAIISLVLIIKTYRYFNKKINRQVI